MRAIISGQQGSRCAEHPNRWRSGSTREWRKTRERILARDGYRCTVHIRPGERCEGTRLLEVHHIDDEESDVLLVPDDESRPFAAGTIREADRAGGTLGRGGGPARFAGDGLPASPRARSDVLTVTARRAEGLAPTSRDASQAANEGREECGGPVATHRYQSCRLGCLLLHLPIGCRRRSDQTAGRRPDRPKEHRTFKP